MEVREALSHAVNRQRIVDTILPEGGEVATQFHPDTLHGWSPDVRTFDYDPDLARGMLEEPGHAAVETEDCYPTEATRPDVPARQDLVDWSSEDLQEVAVPVEAITYAWAEYVHHVDA